MDLVKDNVDELARKLRKRMVIGLEKDSWLEAGQSLKYAVLLKRASGRPVKKKILSEILVGVWKVKEKPTFQNVENNTLLINFNSEEDRKKVMEGGPWSFEGEALVLQKWEEGMTAEDFNNTKIDIFVQVFALPFELRKDAAARGVVEQIGVIKEHQSNGSLKTSAYGKDYMRYRIEVDINVPISSGFFLERRGRKPTWINLKYERLPNVCYNCGVLAHDTRSCTLDRGGKETEFGRWLKAEDRMEHILTWDGSRAPAVYQEASLTQAPMCVDLVDQEVEQDKRLQIISYIGKCDEENGRKRTEEQKQSHVKGKGSQGESEFEVGAFEQEFKTSGPGLLENEMEDKEMSNVDGPTSYDVVRRELGPRKRELEDLREEERNLEKKKRAGGDGQRGRLDGKMEMDQANWVDAEFINDEAESAEHLRRKK